MKTIYLVRHGETSWNRQGRIQGWSYIGLNETGNLQARSIGEQLATECPDLSAIYSSDLPRATETAEIVASNPQFTDLEIHLDDAWRERDFGVYQGYDSQRFFEQHPEYAILSNGYAAAKNVPEGGESYVDFDRRIRASWSSFLENIRQTPVCLVTHSGVIRQILASYQGVDYRTAIDEIDLENCSFTRITYDGNEHTVDVENECDFIPNDES